MTHRFAIAALFTLTSLSIVGCDDKKEDAAGAASASGKAADASAAAKTSSKAVHGYLPASCEVIGLFDVKANLAEPSIKSDVVPKLEKAVADAMNKPDNKDFAAFVEKTGLKPVQDIHAVAFCVNGIAGDGDPQFTVAVKGNLKPGSLVPALLESKDKAKFKEADIAGIKTVTRDEVIIGQAGDGTLIASNHKASFEAAAKGDSKAADTAKLPVDKSFSVVAEGAPIAAAVAKTRGANPFKAHAAKLKKIVNYSDMKAYTGETRISMADEASAKAAGAELQGLLDQVAKQPMPGGTPDMQNALKDMKLEYEGADIVIRTKSSAAMIKQLLGGVTDQLTELLK
jgi:hypothetical protein